ncbi:MAG: hypothetical protein PHC62_09030 [Candidatus Izemoplasmatales bacterium]|nr:hypothetical protein [Candidatus Izemoplasmatales bacterium]
MLILMAIISIITLMGYKNRVTSTLSVQRSPSMPVVDLSNYFITYIAIRYTDDFGKTVAIEYYYDNLNDVFIFLDSILIDLENTVPNGGIGPKSGRYNNGWIELVGLDNSILTFNLYLIEDKAILGVYFSSNMTEYFYNDLFSNQIKSILDYYQNLDSSSL